MSADRNGERSALLTLDWWPGRSRLSAIVRRSRVRCDAAGRLLLKGEEPLVQGVSKFKDWELRNPTLEKLHGEWVYGTALNNPGPGETMEFLWNPPLITDLDEETEELLVDEDTDSEEYTWPPILMDLQIILDATKAAKTGLLLDLSAAVDRSQWRDGVTRPSQVKVRTYASKVKPPLSRLKCDTPMPGQIRGDYLGVPIRLPACLHPEVIMESVNSDDAVIYDCTPSREGLRTGNTLVLRATNHVSWREHVFYNKPQKDGGLWLRTEKTVLPPPMTPITYA